MDTDKEFKDPIVFLEEGALQIGTIDPTDKPLTSKTLLYLETYAKTLDKPKAMKTSRLTSNEFSHHYTSSSLFRDRIRKIQTAWLDKFELSPEVLKGKLMQTMHKLEKAIDEKEYSVASAYMKGYELAFKTAGLLQAEMVDTRTQIQVNLNLGIGTTDKKKRINKKKIVVDASSKKI